MQKFTTCLMFVGDQYGKAEEAMNLYVSLFDNSRILAIERYGTDQEERGERANRQDSRWPDRRSSRWTVVGNSLSRLPLGSADLTLSIRGVA